MQVEIIDMATIAGENELLDYLKEEELANIQEYMEKINK